MVLSKWERTVEGVGVPIDCQTLFSLQFADDQVVIGQEFTMRRLDTEYGNWRLQVSSSKIEYLAVNTNAHFEIMVNDDVNMTQMEQFKYLDAMTLGCERHQEPHTTEQEGRTLSKFPMMGYKYI